MSIIRKEIMNSKNNRTPEQVYTNDLSRLSDFIAGVSIEITTIRKDFEKNM